MITECSRSQSHQTTQRHTHSHTIINSQLRLNKAQVSFYAGCHLHSDVPDCSLEGFQALDLLMTYTGVTLAPFTLFFFNGKKGLNVPQGSTSNNSSYTVRITVGNESLVQAKCR